MIQTREEIESALKAGTFHALIGAKESDFFEAKAPPVYDLGTHEGLFELAKDVSSLANEVGGILVVGLVTARVETEATDVVTDLALLAETDFPAAAYRSALDGLVHPKIQGLVVQWIPSAESAEKGVGVFLVPPQPEDRKPFLVAKLIDSTGTFVKQIVFGYARRIGSSSTPHTVDKLAELVRNGRSTVAQRLTRMDAKLDVLLEQTSAAPPKAPPKPVSDSDINNKIDDILSQS